jgi:hypothetical protein
MRRFGFLVFGAVAILAAAACGSISMGTPDTSAPAQSSPTGSHATTAPASKATTAPTSTPKPSSQFLAVGTSTTLAGESSGEKYKVTLSSVVDPATETDGMGLLPSGDRLVAVNLTIANAGTGIQQESIDDDVTLIDSGGHAYDGLSGAFYSVSQCQTFSGSATLPPNQSESGCVIFAVPSGAVLSKFQYIPNAGFASSLGEWNLG